VTSDHMNECMTLSDVKTAVNQYKKVFRTRSSHIRNVDTRQSLYEYLL